MATPLLPKWDQISSEHCYPKLMALWGSTRSPLPTFHLFRSTNDKEDHSNETNDESMEERYIHTHIHT